MFVATLVTAAPACLASDGGCLPPFHLTDLFRSARKLLRGRWEDQSQLHDNDVKTSSQWMQPSSRGHIHDQVLCLHAGALAHTFDAQCSSLAQEEAPNQLVMPVARSLQ